VGHNVNHTTCWSLEPGEPSRSPPRVPMEPPHPHESAAGGRKRRRRGGGRNRWKPSSSSQQEPPPAAAPAPLSSPPAKRRRKDGTGQAAAAPKRGNTSSLLEKMRARLSGGHFRMLNEKLYTCSGQDAFDYFKNDPTLFDVVSYFSSLFYYWHLLILKGKFHFAITLFLANKNLGIVRMCIIYFLKIISTVPHCYFSFFIISSVLDQF